MLYMLYLYKMLVHLVHMKQYYFFLLSNKSELWVMIIKYQIFDIDVTYTKWESIGISQKKKVILLVRGKFICKFFSYYNIILKIFLSTLYERV